jgi:hydrogenase maturation protease
VIGVGNILLRDDGIGVRVVDGLRRLQEEEPGALPRETLLVDGGTLLPDLLHLVRDARGLVLVDAVRLGGPVGSLCVRHDDEIDRDGGSPGVAPTSIGELLAVARLLGWMPERSVLVGIEVDHTEFGQELSPAVAAALPRAIETVCAELRAMDGPLEARQLAVATPTKPTGAQP